MRRSGSAVTATVSRNSWPRNFRAATDRHARPCLRQRDRLSRPRQRPPRSRQPARLPQHRVPSRGRVLYRGRARERRLRRRPTSTTRASATTCSRSRTRCGRNISRSIKAGFVLQVDDAVLANMYDHLIAAEPEALSRMGGAAGRRAQSRARRHSGGSHPLPRLLRKLARAARRRRAARRHRRPDPEGERRRLFDRGGQCPPRARMVCVAKDQAAARQDLDPRRGHAPHHDGRAPAAGRGTDHHASQSSLAARTSSPAPIAASRRRRTCSGFTRRSCGRSSKSLAEGARLASQELWGR